jgi:hypothetical protein
MLKVGLEVLKELPREPTINVLLCFSSWFGTNAVQKVVALHVSPGFALTSVGSPRSLSHIMQVDM